MLAPDRLPSFLTEPTDKGFGRDHHLSDKQLEKRIEQRRGIASQEEMVLLFAHALRLFLNKQNIMTGEIRLESSREFNTSVSFTLFLRKAGGTVAQLRYRVGMDAHNQLFVRELPQLQKAREAVKALRLNQQPEAVPVQQTPKSQPLALPTLVRLGKLTDWTEFEDLASVLQTA